MKYLLCKQWDTQHSKGILTLNEEGFSKRILLYVMICKDYKRELDLFSYKDFYSRYKEQLIELTRRQVQ